MKNMDVKRHSDIVDAIDSGDADDGWQTAVRDHMAAAATCLVDGTPDPGARPWEEVAATPVAQVGSRASSRRMDRPNTLSLLYGPLMPRWIPTSS